MSDSEDLKIFLEDFVDFLNAQESSIVNMRLQLEKLVGAVAPVPKGSPKLPFDVSKIQWQDKENERGKFQLSEDYSNPDHKALLKFLNEHAGGCINSEGYFYWVFKNGSTIGRKKRKQT
jgi:hypothetical protein